MATPRPPRLMPRLLQTASTSADGLSKFPVACDCPTVKRSSFGASTRHRHGKSSRRSARHGKDCGFHRPLEADTLGVGKKGDNVTEYANCDVVDNGNTMICSGYTADGSNTWVVTYDAHKKQLKTTWSTSSGISASGRIYRRGEQWINPSVGCKPDGTKVTYNHVITISDQGDTHTWDGKVSSGNDPVVETQQVYHRISR